MSDQSVKLGQLVECEHGRDAIHIAVLPVVAAVRLWPSQDAGLDAEGRATVSSNPVGIIDPFLKQFALPGQRVWLLLYPGTITGLRHEWTHPEIDAQPQPPEEQSETVDVNPNAFIRRVADLCGVTYERMIEIATDFAEHGVWEKDNDQRYEDVPYDDWLVFWVCFEKVTGIKYGCDMGRMPFSCSC